MALTNFAHQSGGLDAVGEGPDLLRAEQRLLPVLLVALEDGAARLLADGARTRPQEHLVHRLDGLAERILGEVGRLQSLQFIFRFCQGVTESTKSCRCQHWPLKLGL